MGRRVREIVLDASSWRSALDFYDAILAAIGAPDWHGRSPDALNDSMVFGGINALEPPYLIRITGARDLPLDARQEVSWSIQAIAIGRQNYRYLHGRDPGVRLLADL